MWSEGEQASPQYGYRVAGQRGATADLSDVSVAGGAELYRWGLRHQGGVRTAGQGAGWVLCGPKCAELGAEATQDFLSPQRSAPCTTAGTSCTGSGRSGRALPQATSSKRAAERTRLAGMVSRGLELRPSG